MLVALLDLEGNVVYVNGASRNLLGHSPEGLVGRHFAGLVAPGLASEALAAFRVAREGRPHLRRKLLIRRRDGSYAHMRIDATPLRDAGEQIEGVVITAHELAEPAARSAAPPAEPQAGPTPTAQQAELIERLPAVVYVAEPGPHGRWHYISPQIEEMLGFSAQQWVDDPGLWASRVHPDDLARVLDEEREDGGAAAGTVASEYRMVARDGRIIWVRDEAVLRYGDDGTPHYDGLLMDVTDRKTLESRLQFFADHDPLTGLRNRRRFLAELELEIKRLRRHSQPVCVLMVDLDELKRVNDSLGHHQGDELLRATAALLTARLRETDTVARLGGDEFAVLLRGAKAPEAIEIAEALVADIRGRARLFGLESTGASIGVCELRRRFQTPDDALAVADKAMYEAKRRGGGQVAFEPEGA